MASPVNSNSLSISGIPKIPTKTLDRISTPAFFALYNALEDKDRFGIIGHKIVHQPSVQYTIPIIGILDYQTLSRTYNRNSREEICDFVIGIEEALISYIESKPFQEMLPLVEKGITKYIISYGSTDNATTALQHAVDTIKFAVCCKDDPKRFLAEYSRETSQELSEIRAKIHGNWEHEDISLLVHGILHAVAKKGANKSCIPEIQSVLVYLGEKQREIEPVLQQELSMLNALKMSSK